MGSCRRPNQVFVRSLVGKPNEKKIKKIYNEAYNQISLLTTMFPPSAKTILQSDAAQTPQTQGAVDPKSKIKELKEKVDSLKGKQVSYKEKMEKKRLKNRLKKKHKSQEKQLLRQQKKEKQLEKKKKGVVATPTPTPLNGAESTSESEGEGSISDPADRPNKLISSKVNIEDIVVKDEEELVVKGKESANGLSNKKLKMLAKKEKFMEKRREKRKLQKQKRKEAALAQVKQLTVKTEPSPPTKKSDKDPQLIYNKIDLESENSKKKFKKEKPKSERDPVKALERIEKLEKKTTELEEKGEGERAAALKNKESWKKALLRAEGVKVKDDVRLIKKTIKRKENKKNKSKTEWAQRKQTTEKRMADAQIKRRENIMKKKKEKKQRKIKKSIKKGRVVI